jgi:hypothetical protein
MPEPYGIPLPPCASLKYHTWAEVSEKLQPVVELITGVKRFIVQAPP